MASSSRRQFNGFEILVSCPSDHYFFDIEPSNMSVGAQTQIAKERKILGECLPRGLIFVHAYENRVDVMRAVIVGAQGTPYHDGLFFFDLQFPPDYPYDAPEVRYRSHGMSINPNITEGGIICLSLLNTWHGSGSERWVPSNSTVLQVLVSIQGLVLNSNPYLNDPLLLVDTTPESYNEEVFVITCKTADFLLRKMPQGFQDFIMAHYSERSTTILEACRAYRSGTVTVGFYGSPEMPSTSASASTRPEVSDKFKKDVGEVFDLLVKTFGTILLKSFEDMVKNK